MVSCFFDNIAQVKPALGLWSTQLERTAINLGKKKKTAFLYELSLHGYGILVIQSFDRFLQIKTNQLGKGSYFILRSEKSEVRE